MKEFSLKGFSLRKSLLLLMLFLPTIGFAEVTDNNFTLNFGAVAMSVTDETKEYDISALGNRDNSYFGGGFNVEVGYLYLLQGTSKVVHGTDARLGFSFGKVFNNDKDSYLISAYAGATYNIGRQIGNGYLMFVIVGVNLGLGSVADIKIDGTPFLFSIVFPFGMQYIFDNGVMLGFKQRIDFGIGGDALYNDEDELIGGGGGTLTYTSYNIALSIGYAFGV